MRKVIFALICVCMLYIAAPALSQEDTGAAGFDEDVIVKMIELSGNYEVADDVILAVVESKVGEPLSTSLVQEDLLRIFELGYFAEEPKVKLSEYEGGARITIKLVENPVVESIDIKGNNALSDQQIMDVMKTKQNTILNYKLLKEQDIQAIENLYKEKGYVLARAVDLFIDEKNNLHIEMSEGIIQDIDVVYITRDEDTDEIVEQSPFGKTKKKVILREMKTKTGDVLNAESIRKDLQRVFNLGLFDDVTWEFDTDPSRVELGKIILQVIVEEGKTGQVGFGAGYSNNSGLTGFLSYSERNLKGMARRINTNVEFGGKGNDFEVGYFEPWIDKKQTSFEINVYNRNTQNLTYGIGGLAINDYEETHRGFNFTVGRPITDYTRVFVGMRSENVNIEPAAYDYLDGAIRSTSLSLRTDTRDNIFEPKTGRFDTGSVEVFGGFLGGDYDYQKFNLDLRRFFPVRDKQVVGIHMFMGLGKDDMPRFDYYDIGGVNTVRGYEEYEYSGSKAIYFNAEYRFSLSGNVSAVAFADAGGVWNNLKDMGFSPDDYIKAVGLGLRLQIPYFGGMGPVRLDYAYAFSKKESKIHFGFGHMF